MQENQEATSEERRGVFAISVAADMVSMQIQNLRVYERRGLVSPGRTPGGSRLYSAVDISRLHRIRELLAAGLNLAGIAHVLALEERVRELEARAGDQSRRDAKRSSDRRTAPGTSSQMK